MIVTTNTTIIHASHFAIEWKKIQDMAYIEVMVLYCQKSRGNYSLHLHPPPSGFFLVSSPQAAASLFMHPLEFSSLIYYMQCSAFEKLGNKKPPCFPPLSPLNFFIWKVRKRFLFVCWRDARGRGTRLTGHLQHFSNT